MTFLAHFLNVLTLNMSHPHFTNLHVTVIRFFTGHSENDDGTIQFIRGKTSISKTVDGVIKIITAAVSMLFYWLEFLSISLFNS